MNMVPQVQDPPQGVGSTNVVCITETCFDPSYFKTISGKMKTAVLVLNMLGFICIQSSAFWRHGYGVFFNVVAHLGLWLSTPLLLAYLFHVVEKYHHFPWLKVEVVGCAALTFLYLIASTMAVSFGSAAYSVAGFFGYLAMVVYGADAFRAARALRAGGPAQGERVLVKPHHVVTPPALP